MNRDGVEPSCGKCQTPSCLDCFPFERPRNPRVGPRVSVGAVRIKSPAVPQGLAKVNPVEPEEDYIRSYQPQAKTAEPNPKDLIGITKVNLFLVPSASKIEQARAMADGALKYGPYNWREHPVKASIYLAACERHMEAWKDGEALAPDSGVHHLGHAIACLGIILDAEASGNLIDDRPVSGPAARLMTGYQHNTREKK